MHMAGFSVVWVSFLVEDGVGYLEQVSIGSVVDGRF